MTKKNTTDSNETEWNGMENEVNDINQGCKKRKCNQSRIETMKMQKSNWARLVRAHTHCMKCYKENLETKLIKWLNWFDKSRLIGVIRSVDISFRSCFNGLLLALVLFLCWHFEARRFSARNNNNLFVCVHVLKVFCYHIFFTIWINFPRIWKRKENMAVLLLYIRAINCILLKLIRLHIGVVISEKYVCF